MAAQIKTLQEQMATVMRTLNQHQENIGALFESQSVAASNTFAAKVANGETQMTASRESAKDYFMYDTDLIVTKQIGGSKGFSNGPGSKASVRALPFPPSPAPHGSSSHTRDGEEPFQKPSLRQRKRWGHQSNVVYGTKKDNQILAGPEETDIFVFKVSKTISETKIKEYMENNGVEAEQIVQASTDSVSKFRSFHVVIKTEKVDSVMVPDFWPSGVGCRFWTARSAKSRDAQDWSSGE